MAAIIPAVVAAGASMYEAHQQRKQQSQLSRQQLELANQGRQTGQGFINQGQQAIGPALSYYTSMLANPREATAPEQNRISGMYAGSVANALNMGPRGGMFGPSQAANIGQQERQAQQGVIQQGRPMAANALSSLGTQLSGLGLQSQGLGAGIYGNVFNQGLQANQQQYQQGAGLGSALFNAYQMYLLNRATNTGNTDYGMYGGMGTGSYNPGTDTWQGFYGDGSYT